MRDYPALEVQQVPGAQSLLDVIGPVVDDFHPTAIEDLGETARVFFADDASRQAALTAVRRQLPGIAARALDVSDENWAERSQASLKAIRVGGLSVAPPWDVPPDGQTVIILPSTGFGTGHHATTRLCLAALQEAGAAGRVVLDVGTGSGVLAIASVLMGASNALAIDYDQDAIDNALENLGLNAHAIDRRAIEIRRASIEDANVVGTGAFDIVLANLTGATLVRFADALKRACAPGGALIVSGLREEEESDVTTALGCRVESRASEDGWVALVLCP